MTAPTCVVPMGWTIGQACACLCGLAETLGSEQRALFNWVLLIAKPEDRSYALARRYWLAVDARLSSTAEVPAELTLDLAPAEVAATADFGASELRAALAHRRGQA